MSGQKKTSYKMSYKAWTFAPFERSTQSTRRQNSLKFIKGINKEHTENGSSHLWISMFVLLYSCSVWFNINTLTHTHSDVYSAIPDAVKLKLKPQQRIQVRICVFWAICHCYDLFGHWLVLLLLPSATTEANQL